MCSHLSCYQLETDCYLHRMLYVNLMVTTGKKLIVNTQKKMRNELKHTAKENHQNTKIERKRRRKEQIGTTKTARKQLTKWQ